MSEAPSSPADYHRSFVDLAASGDVTILDLLDSLPWFRGAADWTAWRAFLCALYALPMSDRELAIYRECTGRRLPPSTPAREAWLPTGRRARKTAITSLCAVWHGALHDHSSYTAPGERAQVVLLGKSKDDAKQLHRYVRAILETGPPWLASLIDGEPTAEGIRLTNGCDYVIKAVGHMAGRSGTIVFAGLDEVAFWPADGSATPDIEVLRGIDPSMVMVPHAVRIGLSSPYGRRGVLWDAYHAHYGHDGDPVLVWKAPTLRMHEHPEIRREVEEAYRTDPVSAAAEYGAEFREDTSGYLTESAIRACVIPGRIALPPAPDVAYHAWCDPSGGSVDSMTLAIAHQAKGKVILDYLGEWPAPFDPPAVVGQIAGVLAKYRLGHVYGDRYGGEWPRSRFADVGLAYVVARETKRDIYLNALPMVTGGHAELLDNARLIAQLVALQRRVAAGGRDIIDHPKGEHDDVANAALGAMRLAEPGLWTEKRDDREAEAVKVAAGAYLTPLEARARDFEAALKKTREQEPEEDNERYRYGRW